MKKHYYLFLLILICSCEDVIDVETPTTNPKLVVEANVTIYSNEAPIQIDNWIKLSLTTDYFDTESKPVTNAQVSITNVTNGTTHNYIFNAANGYYEPENSVFTPEFGNTYQLNIIYKNETYSAETTLIPSVPIDKITQGDGTLFGGDETEIVIEFTDDANRDDFYLLDLDYNEFIVTEDEFYQGEKFVFSYFYDDLVSGQEITVKITGVEKQYFNYMNLILEQTRKNNGGPLDTTPATIRGNIVNTTNLENYALGYFNISEVNTLSYTIN